MTKPLPMEMRERAVRFVQAGESRHKVAARFGVAPSTVIDWLARFEKACSRSRCRSPRYCPTRHLRRRRERLS